MNLVADVGAGLGLSLLAWFADGSFEATRLGQSALDAHIGQLQPVDGADQANVPEILAKFALLGLTQSFAREFQFAGLRVCRVIWDGIIGTACARAMHNLDPARTMKSAEIVETCWHIYHQPKSTWAHELDLHPTPERP